MGMEHVVKFNVALVVAAAAAAAIAAVEVAWFVGRSFSPQADAG